MLCANVPLFGRVGSLATVVGLVVDLSQDQAVRGTVFASGGSVRYGQYKEPRQSRKDYGPSLRALRSAATHAAPRRAVPVVHEVAKES